jgi:hypothetical protein
MVHLKRVVTFLIVLTSLNSYGASTVFIKETKFDRLELYGPAVIPYCGGWIETYITRFKRLFKVTIKLEPPKGKDWILEENNISIVDAAYKTYPLVYSTIPELDTEDDEKMGEFTINYNVEEVEGFEISYQNIKGCPKVLKKSVEVSLSKQI